MCVLACDRVCLYVCAFMHMRVVFTHAYTCIYDVCKYEWFAVLVKNSPTFDSHSNTKNLLNTFFYFISVLDSAALLLSY